MQNTSHFTHINKHKQTLSMTWMLKIEWESKEALDRFVDGLKPFDDPAEGIIDMEFEELDDN